MSQAEGLNGYPECIVHQTNEGLEDIQSCGFRVNALPPGETGPATAHCLHLDASQTLPQACPDGLRGTPVFSSGDITLSPDL